MKTSVCKSRFDLVDHIGNTPLLRLQKVLPDDVSPRVQVYAKAEWFNPGGSVKDRPALRMIRDGIASGNFKKGQTLIDSTSGNTGIAYAMIGAAMGFPVTLVMPKNVSLERKAILEAYGATIIFTDPLEGSDGARQVVQELAQRDPQKYFFPDQYSNDSNWKAHYETTGPEIWRDTEGKITHFVAGMGTSGTMMGTGRYLKSMNNSIVTLALQPESFHGVEGWKNMDSSVPVKIYDPKVHNIKMTVPTEPAYGWAKELACKEGLLVSPSAGAAFYGALECIKSLKEGVVVVLFADGGDRYLSTGLWSN